MKKSKMSDEQKLILIYSVELGIFAIVFFVLAFLKLFNIWNTDDTRALIFNIITTIGGLVILGDFLWAVCSKKRKAKVCLLDKILNLPLGIYFLVFSTLSFVNRGLNGNVKVEWHNLAVAIAFFYLAINFGFQAIYHYKHPIPQVIEEINKMKEE